MMARIVWALLCSGARLIPTGFWWSSLIRRPPVRTFSQLSGDVRTPSHKSLR